MGRRARIGRPRKDTGTRTRWRELLDRHETTNARITGAIESAHPATTDQVESLVAPDGPWNLHRSTRARRLSARTVRAGTCPIMWKESDYNRIKRAAGPSTDDCRRQLRPVSYVKPVLKD